jgi:hypothetical protein
MESYLRSLIATLCIYGAKEMNWNTLNFGKHKGKSLPQVLFTDPDWFFWAVENNVFDSRPLFKTQAQDLYRKARCIKVPQKEDERLVAEYWIHRPTGKFSHFDLVPENLPKHKGASPTFRSKSIDMSVPRNIAKYDKTGCKSLLLSLKHYLFGNKSTKMTRERCEQFFEDSTNFD